MAKVLIGNFKGPKGDKGAQGATGPKGEQGIQGPVGPAGGVDSVNGVQGDVVIGGRNLLQNTQTFAGWRDFSSNYPVTIQDGIATVSVTGDTTGSNHYSGLISGYDYLPYADYEGKEITISFDIKSDDWSKVDDANGSTGLAAVAIELGLTSAGENSKGAYFFTRLSNSTYIASPLSPVDGQWLHVVLKPFVINEHAWNNNTSNIEGYPYLHFQFMVRRNGTVSWKNFKMEVGNVATDWTPAPEDTLTNIDYAQENENIILGTKSASNCTIFYSDVASRYVDAEGFTVTRFIGKEAATMACFMETIYTGTCLTDDATSGFTMDTNAEPGLHNVTIDVRTNNADLAEYIITADFQIRLCLQRDGAWRNLDYIRHPVYRSGQIKIESDEEWHTLKMTWDMPDVSKFTYYQGTYDAKAGEKISVSVGFIIPARMTSSDYFEFRKFKIGRGPLISSWKPAIEDYLGPENIWNIPNMHRNIFRGKSLGSTFTDEQKAAIASGTFDDLYIGDYWTINKHTWRIADFDYWLGTGSTACSTHHIVVVPDKNLYSNKMTNTASTTQAYYNSDMRTTNLEQAKEIIRTDFGATSVLTHKEFLVNSLSDNRPSAGAWYDSDVELMNEYMVFGTSFFAAANSGSSIPYIHTIDTTQLALFQKVRFYINPNRTSFWLRDVAGAARYSVATSEGLASYTTVTSSMGVRPVVGIIGT